jgi:hypothetical protein
MSSCDKNGECLIQCGGCECFNEVCICGHRGHESYCPSNCCLPVDCRNYKYCNVKQPKWVSFCHNGMCGKCAVQMGKHTVTTQVEDCCVCLENDHAPLCPLCRNVNDWG